MHLSVKSIALCLLAIVLFSCGKKKEKDHALKAKSTEPAYFSIKDFIRDQWKTYHGQPVMIQQYTTINGKTDSNLLSALTMKWSPIMSVFFETDISDPKFTGQYEEAMFEENTTQTRNFTLTAKDPELLTQKIHIAADLYTSKIRSIYIETQKKTFWNTQIKKLVYSPMHTLQIQEHNYPRIGSEKETVVFYKFL